MATGISSLLTRCPTELLHNCAVGLISHGETTVVLISGNAEEAGLAHFLPHIVGEFVAVIDILCDFLRDLSPGKLNGSLPQFLQIILGRRGKSFGMLGRRIALLVKLSRECTSAGNVRPRRPGRLEQRTPARRKKRHDRYWKERRPPSAHGVVLEKCGGPSAFA